MGLIENGNGWKYEDKSFWQRVLWSKLHGGRFNYIETDGDVITQTTYHVFKPKERVTSINLSNVSFFDVDGIFKKSICFGYDEKFILKSISSHEIEVVKNSLANVGVVFFNTKKVGKSFSSKFLFSSAETLTITDTGVSFSSKSFSKESHSFVPFDKIDYVLFEKKWMGFRRKISLIGELAFSSTRSFPAKIQNLIQAELKAHIKVEDGKVYHPNIFSGVPKRKSISLIFFEDKIIYMNTNKSENNGKTVVYVLRKIESYKCTPIFSLFNRVANIKGEGAVDLRTNTSIEYVVSFPGVFFFSWGKMKSQLKKLK